MSLVSTSEDMAYANGYSDGAKFAFEIVDHLRAANDRITAERDALKAEVEHREWARQCTEAEIAEWDEEWTALEAERDAARTEREAIRKSRLIECEALIAERDAARKALEQIYAGSEDDKPPFRAMDRQQMRQVARAALTSTPPVPSDHGVSA